MGKHMEEKKSLKGLWLAIGLILLLGAGGMAGYFFLEKQLDQKVYLEKLEAADKYVSDQEYEAAILYYQEAIRISPKEAEAYVKLSDVYKAQGEYAKAKEILSKGYKQTGDRKLKNMLNSLLGTVETETLVQKKETIEGEKQPKDQGQTMAMDTAFLSRMNSIRYGQLKEELGNPVSWEQEGEMLVLRHENSSIRFYYQEIEGSRSSFDGETGLPVEGAKPCRIRLEHLSTLFPEFDKTMTREQVEEAAGVGVSLTYNRERETSQLEFELEDCRILVESDSQGTIQKETAWNEIYLTQEPPQEDLLLLEGTIASAVTEKGISGAILTFTGADGAEEEAETAADGSWRAELPLGDYQVEVRAQGYVTETREIKEEEMSQDGALSEILLAPETGEITIVLEWQDGRDLDAHLEGTFSNGEQIHVSYMDKTEGAPGMGAELDIDKIDGFGPETITIEGNGSFTYWVDEFTGPGNIGTSGAVVRVYVPGQEVRTYQASGGLGEEWRVFTIENGVIREP